MSSDVLFLLVVFVLIAIGGLFVAAEFALLTVDRSKVHRLVRSGDKGARGVEMALKSLSTQLSGAQLGITITNLLMGFLAQPSIGNMLRPWFSSLGFDQGISSSISLIIAILLVTTLTMVFGELIPKNLAIALPIETAKKIQQFQRGFSWLMTYPILFCNGTANAIIRKFGIEPREELASARSGDELSSLVRRSAEKGTLAQDTALMLERSLTFGDRRVEEVMTPRARVEMVSHADTVHDVISMVKKTGFSRFPVMGEDVDDIVGVVHVKHAVKVPLKKREKTQVKSIMQKPLRIPSNIQLDPVLEKLRKSGLHMAILIDEFGGTDGIVTVEDLIEELVGEVRDEHDVSNSVIQQNPDGSWIYLAFCDQTKQVSQSALPSLRRKSLKL